jgi:nitrate/nitrite-specific signal transduction histidine kinase
MRLTRLKWVFLGTALVFLCIMEVSRRLIQPYLDSWGGHLLMSGVVLTGILFYFGATFELMSRMQDRLERQNRELLALHEASSDIYGELALETVLQKVVDQARQLLEARYGALAVVDSDGRIEQFLVSGIEPAVVASIPHPPRGEGLLGVVLNEGQRLRIGEMSRHPRSAGFPPNHPPMRSLLAVPVCCQGPFRGNLYLADKESAPEFSTEDEDTLERFAAAAGIAIDNVYLHQRTQAFAVTEERLRIAREMHDGMAQVVAYVNTKAQAVQAFLEKGKQEEAVKQLDELARASRDVYHEIREGITALRTGVGPDQPFDETLRAYVERWREQSGIDAQLDLRARPSMTPLAELQLLRILQEALSNVRKHARAASARVELAQRNGKVYAAVQDDGHGFDQEAMHREGFPRFGLAIMRERAQSIGAKLSIESAPGRGTRVSVEIPVIREESQPTSQEA